MARRCSVERANQQVGGFACAKKNLFIQYQGKEYEQDQMMEQVRQQVIAEGMTEEEIEQIDLYVKPQEQTAFYVVNGNVTGRVQLD